MFSRNHFKIISVILFVVMLTDSNVYCQNNNYDLRELKNESDILTKTGILNQMRQTLDWQLNNMPEESWLASQNRYVKIEGNGWIRGAFYTGVMAAYKTIKDPKYLINILEWGKGNNWEPGKEQRFADDHCCVQTYVDVYLINNDPEVLKPSIKTFDVIVEDPLLGSKVGWEKRTNWNWCDALYMAPPAMVRLAAATQNSDYLKTMDLMYWDTYNYLFDKEYNLFYRDDRFKPDADPLVRSENGKPVFWSRGNGWVLAGLARILEFMPDEFDRKNKYEKLFIDMSNALKPLQDDKGLWHSNLLDPVDSPEPESSGTAFFCYGLAWGVNNGYLDRDTFLPAILNAWKGLNRCLDENGQLHWVQLVGSAPAEVKYEDSVEYATGAFLLAGSEVIKLVE